MTLENHYKTFSITNEIGISDTLISINLESKEQIASYRFPNLPSRKKMDSFSDGYLSKGRILKSEFI